MSLSKRWAAAIPWPLLLGGLVAALVFWPVLKPQATTQPPAGFGVWLQNCRQEPMDLAPEEWTRLSDSSRIRDGKYVDPLPLQCVLGSYRRTALARYAEAGDPVAVLAVSYRTLLEAEDACAVLPTLRTDLEQAGEARRRDYVFDEEGLEPGRRPRARLPEALVVLAQLEHRCGDEEAAGERLAEAERLGFDIDWFSQERPDRR